AIELGVNFLDNADVYARGKAEVMVGQALADLDVPRHHVVVSSKVYWPMSDVITDRGLSRKHILESIDNSLERLGMDYIDIYFAHRYDTETPIEETVEAFSDVVRSGRALYWGTSMWTPAQIAEAHTFAKANGLVAPVTEQPEYSMLRRSRVEEHVLPVVRTKGIGLVVWSPLAQGMLTGKYDDGVPEGSRFANFEQFKDRFLTDENVATVRDLAPIAQDLGITRAQLALAWALRRPPVASVIPGGTRVEQLDDNVHAADVELTDDVRAKIDDVLGGDQDAACAGLPAGAARKGGVKLYRAAQMREADMGAVDAGIAGPRLMDAAGRAVARVLRERFPQARRALVLAGKGNNGGDGYVAAAALQEGGIDAHVLELAPEPSGDDARGARSAFVAAGGAPALLTPAVLADGLAWADVVVDALLGVGLDRP